jgi:hypothetical protein
MQLVHHELLPLLQLSGSVLQLCADILIYQQELPQLQVVTRQKILFLDSAECPVA